MCLGAVGILFIVFAGPIVGWFTSDAEVAAIGARGLRLTSSGFLFYSTAYVLTQAFNGAGDTWTPTLINIVCLWLGEIPIAYLLARPLGYGPNGVFGAFPIAFGVMAAVSAIVFRRGGWKSARV